MKRLSFPENHQEEYEPIEKHEPIWKGILKIAGVVGVAGAILSGIIYFVVTVNNHTDKRQQDIKVHAMEEGNTGRSVTLIDQDGSFMGYKMTYEGHDYLKASTGGGMVHSESCSCKDVEEEEKP
jgi:hypothetical protein